MEPLQVFLEVRVSLHVHLLKALQDRSNIKDKTYVCFKTHLVEVGLTLWFAIGSLCVLQVKRSLTRAWHVSS